MPQISSRSIPEFTFSDEIHPLLQRIYAARHALNDQDVDYRLQFLEKPESLKGLDLAINLLANAVQQQQRILIVGDFDADGATSCTLAVLALRAMGLLWVDFLVPNRFDFGYGLTPEIVDVAQRYQPDIIVTVDNGIASVDGVSHANDLGINVIVTDHHLPPLVLPEAKAIVNPNQTGCDFPCKNLAGVGVIFYVMTALRTKLRQLGWFERSLLAEPNLAEYLDLVALGTVADVVPLDRSNRILVQQGLLRVRSGRARPGILALLEVAGKHFSQVSSMDFGFVLGPRLNAAGRLDDISLGIQCLLAEDYEEARTIAVELDQLNRERKAIESSMQREAVLSLNQLSLNEEELPWGLCLYDSRWHQGVIGILASRIKEKYHRPVIAFAQVDEHTIKGSARSIPGLHIRDALDSIATQYPELLQKFGGHAMAAGLTLALKDFEPFSVRFDQVVRQCLVEDELQEVILTDGRLAEHELSLPIAKLIQQAGPFGQQFPEPLFDGEFLIINQRIVGEKHLKLEVASVQRPQQLIDAIFFNIDTNEWPNATIERARVVYQLQVNEYRGVERLQLQIKYIQALHHVM